MRHKSFRRFNQHNGKEEFSHKNLVYIIFQIKLNMKKNLCIAASLIFSAATYAQVAINNNSLKATLDVTAKTTDRSKPEGLFK